jgi:hypothetical protein
VRKIEELTCSEAMIGGATRAFHDDDSTAISALNKRFVDYWPFEGDIGGSNIVAAMYARCGRWVYCKLDGCAFCAHVCGELFVIFSLF